MSYRYRPRYTLTEADLGREWETVEQGVVRIDGWDRGKVAVTTMTHPPVTVHLWRPVVEARIDSGMWERRESPVLAALRAAGVDV